MSGLEWGSTSYSEQVINIDAGGTVILYAGGSHVLQYSFRLVQLKGEVSVHATQRISVLQSAEMLSLSPSQVNRSFPNTSFSLLQKKKKKRKKEDFQGAMSLLSISESLSLRD